MGQALNLRRQAEKKIDQIDRYIQYGLIFQLDGIEKGSDQNAWTDLIGGVKFNYVNGVTPLQDHVNFASGHSMFQADTADVYWGVSFCTLEICLDSINQMMIFDNRNLYMALGVYNNRLAFGYNAGGITKDFIPLSFSGFSTLCVNKNSGYQDGIELTDFSTTNWVGGGNGITIGSRDSGWLYTGNIYAIRVYDRFLTQEEAQYNHNIDNARFNTSI